MAPYYVIVDGCEIHCDTADAALALARAAGSPNSKTVARSTNDAEKNRLQRKPLDHSLAFLLAIKDAGEKGIGGERLWKKVGLSSGSALGTTVVNTHRFLNEAAIQFDAVVQRRRSGDTKLWFAGGYIDNGIVAIKDKLNKLFPV